MTDINHRRKNKRPVNQRYGEFDYNNGYAHPENKGGVKANQEWIDKSKAEYERMGITNIVFQPAKSGSQRVGRTDFLDKSMHSWGRKSEFADKTVGAGIGNDFANGHRGMAKAVKGAKKYVRSRVRFHENAQLKKIMHEKE